MLVIDLNRRQRCTSIHCGGESRISVRILIIFQYSKYDATNVQKHIFEFYVDYLEFTYCQNYTSSNKHTNICSDGLWRSCRKTAQFLQPLIKLLL